MPNDQASGPRAHLAPAASRALRVLDFLALTPQSPQPLTAIAQHLDAAKSSILNICAVLEDAGFIEKRPGGYVLGRRILELGGAYVRRFDVVRAFYRLADENEVLHDELVQLGMLFGSEVLYLARKEASRVALRLTAGIGEALPAASTAIGRAVLAHMSRDDVDHLIGREPLPAFTAHSVRTTDELHHALDQVRERGYSLDRGGVFPNVTGVAVALRPTPGERPLALSVSIVDPEQTADVTPIADALRALARQLTNPMVQFEGDDA
jgi:DNA-binding IclR family transcriptional regulator